MPTARAKSPPLLTQLRRLSNRAATQVATATAPPDVYTRLVCGVPDVNDDGALRAQRHRLTSSPQLDGLFIRGRQAVEHYGSITSNTDLGTADSGARGVDARTVVEGLTSENVQCDIESHTRVPPVVSAPVKRTLQPRYIRPCLPLDDDVRATVTDEQDRRAWLAVIVVG